MPDLPPHPEMSDYLRRIAVGPAMSQDLTRGEACHGMELVLGGQVNPVQAGIYLIALRMKRETLYENLGVLDALRAATHRVPAAVPELVELADPYDGFSRHTPAHPFLPAVLAACGLPCVSHGCDSMPPKEGVTHRDILQAAGIPGDRRVSAVAAQLADPAVGWGYVDLACFSPEQMALAELRRQIVKRPCLSTLEKLCSPVHAPTTHLVIGYVHSAYRTLLMELADAYDWQSVLVVKGAEGGVIAKLQRPESLYRRAPGAAAATDWSVDPADCGLAAAGPTTAMPPDGVSLAAYAATQGLAALDGAPGLTRDSLILSAATILTHTGKQPDLPRAAAAARAALDTGTARARFQAARA